MDMYETFFSVLGRDRMKKTQSPTIPHTIVQVAWPVIALKAIVKVRRWLPKMKICGKPSASHALQLKDWFHSPAE